MFLQLNRDDLMTSCTLGTLLVNGDTYQTLEPTVRNEKIVGVTAIPAGQYVLKLRTEGGMTAQYLAKFGADFHKGMLWLQDVPNFEDVYIHIGNFPRDTHGCILIGNDRGASAGLPAVTDSTAAYKAMYPAVAAAILSGEDVVIAVVSPGGP